MVDVKERVIDMMINADEIGKASGMCTMLQWIKMESSKLEVEDRLW